ncbi:MAG: ribosomal L7Ae/L30e/S12e/Gadd45 family protein [Eubacterium sp.]
MKCFGDCAKVIGTKQTLKAVKEGNVAKVILAEDTEEPIKEKIVEACEDAGILIENYESRAILGQDSGIERSAAVIALLK